MASVHFDIDASDLKNLEIDLRGAPKRIQFAASKTLRRSGLIVKDQMAKDARGHHGSWWGHPFVMRGLPRAVDSEMIGRLTVEVGFNKVGQGKLANIMVYGSVNNAPVFDHTASLRRSLPVIEEMFGEAGEESVLGVRR